MARGLVVRIGDTTVMGRIASLTSGVDSGPTPMAREIQEFIHLVSFIAIFTGAVIFTVAMVLKYSFSVCTTICEYPTLSLTGSRIQLD